MKTLAKQKINEKTEILIARAKRAKMMYEAGNIPSEMYDDRLTKYTNTFKGYIDAFADMEILEGSEYGEILTQFHELLSEVVK